MDKSEKYASHTTLLLQSEMELKVGRGWWTVSNVCLPHDFQTQKRECCIWVKELGAGDGNGWVAFTLHSLLSSDQSLQLLLLLGR